MKVLTDNKERREIVDRLLEAGHIKLSEALTLLESEVVYTSYTATYRSVPYYTGLQDAITNPIIGTTGTTYSSSTGTYRIDNEPKEGLND